MTRKQKNSATEVALSEDPVKIYFTNLPEGGYILLIFMRVRGCRSRHAALLLRFQGWR